MKVIEIDLEAGFASFMEGQTELKDDPEKAIAFLNEMIDKLRADVARDELRKLETDKLPVKLLGEDGNAAFLIGRCSKVMRRNGVSKEARDAFMKEATASDYDHVLQTIDRYFEIE